MNICIGKYSIYEVRYYPWFQESTESLGMYPPRMRGTTVHKGVLKGNDYHVSN